MVPKKHAAFQGSSRGFLCCLFPILVLATSPALPQSVDTAIMGTVAQSPLNGISDLPPLGISLFDQLFIEHRSGQFEYNIPYPFEKFVSALAKKLPSKPGQYSSPFANVMIPLGRSLQREAAWPEFFGQVPRDAL